MLQVLNVLNWKTATHFGTPPVGAAFNAGDMAGHVTEVSHQLRSLVDRWLVGGDRSTAQQAAQLLLSCHQLGLRCLALDELAHFEQQLVRWLLHNLDRLGGSAVASPAVVHWFLVVLARLQQCCAGVDVTAAISAALERVVGRLHQRQEPLQQLLQVSLFYCVFKTISLSYSYKLSTTLLIPISNHFSLPFR